MAVVRHVIGSKLVQSHAKGAPRGSPVPIRRDRDWKHGREHFAMRPLHPTIQSSPYGSGLGSGIFCPGQPVPQHAAAQLEVALRPWTLRQKRQYFARLLVGAMSSGSDQDADFALSTVQKHLFPCLLSSLSRVLHSS